KAAPLSPACRRVFNSDILFTLQENLMELSLPLLALAIALPGLALFSAGFLWQKAGRQALLNRIEEQQQQFQQQLQEQQLEQVRLQERNTNLQQHNAQQQQWLEQARNDAAQQQAEWGQQLQSLQRQLATEREARLQEQKHADENGRASCRERMYILMWER